MATTHLCREADQKSAQCRVSHASAAPGSLPNDPQPCRRRSSLQSSSDEDGDVCWVCYGGEESGELISPCQCRGSVRWVHGHCLKRWMTTRVISAQAQRRDNDTRFSCPNCKAAYTIVDDDPASITPPQLLCKSETPRVLALPRRCGFMPNLHKLSQLDDDLVDSFNWRIASVVVVALLWAVLLLGTLALLGGYMRDISREGDTERISLKDLPRPLDQLCRSTYRLLTGDELTVPPLRYDGTIGTKWSKTFQRIQAVHTYVFLANVLGFVLGIYNWVRPVDLACLPSCLHRFLGPHTKLFICLCVNPPLLSYLRAWMIGGLVFVSPFEGLENFLVGFVYHYFTSSISTAVHLFVTSVLATFWARSIRSEWARILLELDSLYRLQNMGSVQIVGKRRDVAGLAARKSVGSVLRL